MQSFEVDKNPKKKPYYDTVWILMMPLIVVFLCYKTIPYYSIFLFVVWLVHVIKVIKKYKKNG